MSPQKTLRDWLAAQGKRPGTFASDIGYDRGNFHRLMNGEHWPSLELALKIEQETAGAVPMSLWAQAKAARQERAA
jgi:hypothetical protein